MKIRTAFSIGLLLFFILGSIKLFIYPIFKPPLKDVAESELVYAGKDKEGEHWYWVFKEEAMDWLPILTSTAIAIAYFIKPKQKRG